MNKVLYFLYELLPYKIISLRRKRQYDSFKKFCLKNYLQSSCVFEAKEKIIWVYWHQGINDAPPLVKKCVSSIISHSSGFQVIVLDRNTFGNYVAIDNKIVKMVDNGDISIAHFSDILRLSLLKEYGGIWIDSTVYLSSDLPQELTNSRLFVFKGSSKDDFNLNNPSCISNWFIVSDKNNPIIVETLVLMEKYILTHKRLCSYYLCHWIMTFIFKHYRFEEWYSMPHMPNILPHTFQFFYCMKAYDEKLFDIVMTSFFCHKLSYKLDVLDGTMLDYFVNGVKYEKNDN